MSEFVNPLMNRAGGLEKKHKKYTSNFDYSAIGIIEVEKIEELEELSKSISETITTLQEKRITLMRILEKAYEYFPKDGSFGKWCEASGMSRQDVSMLNKRVEFTQIYHIEIEKAAELPDKVIAEGTKKNMEFSQVDIAEIISSEEPYSLWKQKKEELKKESKTKNLSVATDKYRTDIENAEIIEVVSVEAESERDRLKNILYKYVGNDRVEELANELMQFFGR